MTDCRKGYAIQGCKNGPKATTTAATAASRRAQQQEPRQAGCTAGGTRAWRDHASSRADAITDALGRLDELTRRLRVECPWDREQDERTIVPHTVEEAYELADAANQRRRRQAARRARRRPLPGALPVAAARGARRRRPRAGRRARAPEARPPPPARLRRGRRGRRGEVLRNWDAIKRTEPGREAGIFGDVPENLPGPLHARKVQRRAASRGFDLHEVPYDAVRAGSTSSRPPATTATPRFRAVGRPALRGGERRAQAQGRPRARAARRQRPLPRRRRARGAARRPERRDLDRPGSRRQLTYYAQARLETTTD